MFIAVAQKTFWKKGKRRGSTHRPGQALDKAARPEDKDKDTAGLKRSRPQGPDEAVQRGHDNRSGARTREGRRLHGVNWTTKGQQTAAKVFFLKP